MSYTITITQKKEEQKEEQGGYCQVGIQRISDIDYLQLTAKDRERYEPHSNGDWIKPLFDYPPKRVVTKTVDTKVFEQTVEELSIADIVAVVNSIRI